MSSASVLDASALLALLHGEAGGDLVVEALSEGAAIGAVNLAEVLSKLATVDVDPESALERIDSLDEALTVHPFGAEDLLDVARLRPLTRHLGLPLADRACLALARRLQVRVLTADRAWSQLSLNGLEVQLIR